ncbi:MAG: DUF1292 domain-containing protein [Lachnospiraceae bacterium]|nr:DUF1292 domain-containing protein [Lachnospiraceae bacterium]
MNNIDSQSSIEDDFTLTLTFESGETVECSVVAIFPVKHRTYIALIPLNEEPGFDPEEVFLYRYTTIGKKDSIKLDTIETDDEYNEAADAFDALVALHTDNNK